MSGDLKTGMVTIGTEHITLLCFNYYCYAVKCVRDKSKYFAERLYKSMKV